MGVGLACHETDRPGAAGASNQMSLAANWAGFLDQGWRDEIGQLHRLPAGLQPLDRVELRSRSQSAAEVPNAQATLCPMTPRDGDLGHHLFAPHRGVLQDGGE